MTNMVSALLMRPLNQRKIAQKQVITAPGGIVEEKFVPINGIDQWISIRGEDWHNPVVLIVHGGPAAVYSIMSPLIRAWEKYFTVVQWEQRGAGRTFRKNGAAGSGKLSLEQLAEDGIALAEYLTQRLDKDRIILIGSSVGSMTGVLMAHKCPDLFYAYVGTEQVSPEGRTLAYKMALDALSLAGKTGGVQELERIGADSSRWTRADFDRFNRLTVGANPNVPHMVSDIIMPSMLTAPGYSLRDVMDIIRGMNFSAAQLFEELMTFDLCRIGLSFELPFFIFQGDGDWLAPYVSAQKYLNMLTAPHKELVLIRQAGHLAMFARPEQFLQELRERVRPLAMRQSAETVLH